MTYHATALILKREPWRDAARIYTLYTREHGKVLAIGRGTRKSLSKLAAHLEPYSLSELLLARGRKIETICGAVLKRQPEPLVVDERRHAAAAFFAEAVDHFVKPGDRDEQMWALCDGFLADLAAAPEEGIATLLSAFTWRFMDTLGYRPRLDACASCKEDIRFRNTLFLPAKGVLICDDCRFDERQLVGAHPLDARILAEISQFIEGHHKGLTPVAPVSLRAGLAFLEAHLDRTLMSLPIVRAILEKNSLMQPYGREESHAVHPAL